MLLKSVSLRNIRSYINQKIDFFKGASLLLGDIGSGKTTVLLAIEFALFGLIKGDVTGSTLLRHGMSEGTVELCFEMQKKQVIIARKLKKKKDIITQDSGYIIIDNQKTELTPVELKSKILELFGYPNDLLNKNTSLIYRYTVYTPQEEMKSILFESREERLDILRKIFNIDKYKRVRENALFYAKELRNTKKILESKLGDLEELKRLLEQKKDSLKEKNDLLIKVLENVNATKKLLKDKDNEIRFMQETIDKINSLRKNLAVLDNDLKNKNSENARLMKEINIVNYRIDEYETKLKDLGVVDIDEDVLKESLRSTEEKLTKINSMKETLRERLEIKQSDLKNMLIEDEISIKMLYNTLKERVSKKEIKIDEYDNTQKEYDSIKLEMNVLKINIQKAKDIINNLKDVSTCPVCLQDVDLSHRVKIMDKENATIFSEERKLKDFEDKTNILRLTISGLKRDIENLHNDEIDLKRLELKIETIEQLQEKKELLISDIKELMQKKEKLDTLDINKLLETISKNRKILNNIGIKKHLEESLKEKRMQKIEIEERLKSLSEEIFEIKQKIETITKEIEEYATIESDFKIKNKEKTDIQKELTDLEITNSLMQRDIENLTSEINKNEKDIDLKIKLKEKINYINNLNHWLTDYFIELTSIIEKNIMYTVHREFNELFKEWFSIIVQDQELDVQIDEDFAPLIRQNNYDTYIDNLSGGEKTAVALAYRLALNKVINDFINNIKTKDIIILDEPTDGFSSEQLDRMRDVLDALKIKQLIIVSHESKMESYADNIIRVQKNNHISTIM